MDKHQASKKAIASCIMGGMGFEIYEHEKQLEQKKKSKIKNIKLKKGST